MQRPLIFDIHRYALDDGPGIRTTVFFKGCPLSCVWCHNPEGQHREPELYFQASKCMLCGDCAGVCPQKAIVVQATVEIIRNQCNACGLCAIQCPTRALTIKGRYYSATHLVDLLLQDRRFYENSHGGVTFSGGEPTLYMGYLNRVIRLLKAHHIHVALQTSGMFHWDRFQAEILPLIDIIYFDIKGVDPEKHRLWTGRTNVTILANLFHLADTFPGKLICSIPLVPRLTAEPGDVVKIAELVAGLADVTYRLQGYHPGGHIKAAALGRTLPEEASGYAMPPDIYQQIASRFDRIVSANRQK